jgi:hypothetical protein
MMRNRGAALSLIGEVANDPDALIDAVGCYQAALGVYEMTATASNPPLPDAARSDGVPSDGCPPGVAPVVLADWVLTQSNLGQALRLLGEHEATPDGTHYLREAVAACEAALAATTRNPKVPQSMANQSPTSASPLQELVPQGSASQGSASQGSASSGSSPQASSPQASALLGSAPQEWAMTATNLANALAALGDRTSDATCLRRAIAAYRQALAALVGARWLRQRAITRHNLTLAERRLAAWEATGA